MSLHDLLAGMPCGASLRGRRVLVVEDEYLTAQDLREELQCWGAVVMGPVARVAEALALLRDGPAPHMAILDIGLRGAAVYPIADALRAQGVPFVFATGYNAAALPDAYAQVPRAEKPLALRGSLLPRHRGLAH